MTLLCNSALENCLYRYNITIKKLLFLRDANMPQRNISYKHLHVGHHWFHLLTNFVISRPRQITNHRLGVISAHGSAATSQTTERLAQWLAQWAIAWQCRHYLLCRRWIHRTHSQLIKITHSLNQWLLLFCTARYYWENGTLKNNPYRIQVSPTCYTYCHIELHNLPSYEIWFTNHSTCRYIPLLTCFNFTYFYCHSVPQDYFLGTTFCCIAPNTWKLSGKHCDSYLLTGIL